MTERWQKELRKLHGVQPSEGAWEQATARAPSGDGLLPTRQRVVAGVVAFGVFIAAASFVWLSRPQAPRTAGEGGRGQSGIPSVLAVVCSDAGADVSSPQVAVQEDGVHVHVDNPGGFDEVVLEPIGDPNPWRFWSGSSGLDGPFIRESEPGRWRVGCVRGEQQDPTAVVGWSAVELIDPNAFWIPTTLACGEGDELTHNEPAPIPKVAGESPEQAIARVLGLREGDLVEEAGYRDSYRQPYRIIRSGEVVAWVLFSDWTEMWWRLTAGWACPGQGFPTEEAR
jgi:hypothetical protein